MYQRLLINLEVVINKYTYVINNIQVVPQGYVLCPFLNEYIALLYIFKYEQCHCISHLTFSTNSSVSIYLRYLKHTLMYLVMTRPKMID